MRSGITWITKIFRSKFLEISSKISKFLSNYSDVKKMGIIYLLWYRGDKINEFYKFIVNRFNGVTKVFILFKFF